MENCKQTNIPKVDNSKSVCKVVLESCVFTTENRTQPINIFEGEPYNEVLNKLLYKIREMEERIGILENQ